MHQAPFVKQPQPTLLGESREVGKSKMSMKEPMRILVLEDDVNMLESLCGVLRHHEYDPRAANNPQDAIDMAKIIPFHLVVSDIRMAGPTDGLGAIRKIKKFQPKVKVVMITGFADDESCRQAIELLVDDYVHKPVRLPVLMEVVQRVLHPPKRSFHPLNELRSWLAAPLKLMEQARAQKVGRLVVLLEEEKHKVLQAFFVAVRAKGITKSAALELWDHLEKLERDWTQLRQPSEEAIQAVGAAYRLVFERLAQFQKTGNIGGAVARDPRAVTRAGFNQLLDLVQSGKLVQEDMLMLLQARLQPERASQLPPALQSVLAELTPSS